MTRPDANAPDSGSNQDDAVWLDLVARLEGRGQGEGPEAPEGGPGEPRDAPSTDRPGGGGSAAPRPFSDFDPLGLSAGAPIELSAEERLARGQASQASAGAAARDDQGTASGPRDGGPGDDDPLVPGDFVPEEPPSLAEADPVTVLAWLGAVGGPVALVMSAMFWRSAPLLAIVGMVAAFAASVVILIMKLPG
ncbi:MAG: hypothetical protein ABWX69_01925, partial [Arthrobacter sp.]